MKSTQAAAGLLEAAPDAMIATSSEGTILLVNRQAELLFGYERDDLVGQKVEVLVPNRYAGRHAAHRDAYGHSPGMRPMGVGLELFARRKDGSEIPVEISLSPVETSDGTIFAAAIRDASERRTAEKRLQEALDAERVATEQLRTLDALKDEFLSIVSHELRTPLTSIAGFAELILTQELDVETQRTLLERIRVNAGEMGRMVDQLLAYSRLEAGRVEVHPVEVDVAEAIAEIVANQSGGLAGHEVEVDVEPSLRALADPGALERVLGNLLSNAAKFSRVSEPITVSAETEGDFACIKVRDRGVGIAADEQARIFERFYQASATSRSAKGTGIGLSIAVRYIELQGGSIWVESEPGEGSTFSFTLPRAG